MSGAELVWCFLEEGSFEQEDHTCGLDGGVFIHNSVNGYWVCAGDRYCSKC